MASGAATELVIPPNALSEPVTIRITELGEIPDGFVDLSPVYLFEPVELTFALPVEVRVPYGNGSGFVPASTALYSSSGGTFQRLRDSYNNAGFAQGSLQQLGWALVGEPTGCAPATCR